MVRLLILNWMPFFVNKNKNLICIWLWLKFRYAKKRIYCEDRKIATSAVEWIYCVYCLQSWKICWWIVFCFNINSYFNLNTNLMNSLHLLLNCQSPQSTCILMKVLHVNAPAFIHAVSVWMCVMALCMRKVLNTWNRQHTRSHRAHSSTYTISCHLCLWYLFYDRR